MLGLLLFAVGCSSGGGSITEIPTYTVVFNSQGGSSVSSQTVPEGGNISIPTAPSRAEYTFGGWYKEPSCINLWNFSSDAVYNNITLYARWILDQIPTYTVTFDSREGSPVDQRIVAHGEKIPEPEAPQRSGYIFTGWYGDAALENIWNFDTGTVTVDMTLYASWQEAPTYTVTFDSREGSPVDQRIVVLGEKVPEPEAPHRDMYIFMGWYGDAALENIWDFNTGTVTMDMTLYASWQEAPTYIVTFESNGGNTIDPQTVHEGGHVERPVDPTLFRYNFEGWYKEATLENSWDFETGKVAGNMTLYAKWSADAELSYPGVVFIAPDGNDSNDGSIQRPFATLRKAKSIVDNAANGVDTVYIRGGVYNVGSDQQTSEDGTWVDVFDFSSNPDTGTTARVGTASKRICYYGFPGERPVFNLSAVRPGKRVRVFYIGRHYYHFKNFEIVGTQVSVTGHTQSECFRVDGGNNNIFENLAMHDGMAIGFYLVRGMNNLVLNCDAYNNHDSFSGGAGNVDGFGGHPSSTGSTGNVFRGCRAWYNGDDGFDLINAFAPYVIDGCWSFLNGYISGTTVSGGDGAGFKSGGYGMSALSASAISNLAGGVPVHVVKNCLAYYNRNQGFYANHHLGGIKWYNNTSCQNPSNFNMLNRAQGSESTNGVDDPNSYGHVIVNNLSYRPRTSGRDIVSGSNSVSTTLCTLTTNSFPGTAPVASDFVNADDYTQLMLPRKADGSLPDIDFLRPVPGSRFIGTGTANAETANTNIGCF